MNPLSILKKYFGYESFRPGQEEIINHILSGNDCLVLMPTGAGKSLCFQIPSLVKEGTTIVISPLIALMKDQVDALNLNGISAAYLNSSQSLREQEDTLTQLEAGELKLLYIAPERLGAKRGSLLKTFKNINISLFAIDESHCISHWGHDFRPDYLSLGKLKILFPSVPLIALTATADKQTRMDIKEQLGINSSKTFISSFNRENLRYLIEPKEDHFSKLIRFLGPRKNESGIIYCLSRQNTEDLAEKLRNEGFHAEAYHAGLENKVRAERQEKFKINDSGIIVATIAFGMGIDKSNVRFVVHTHLPKNIESYYQETGRAGRDGLASEVILYYSSGDMAKLRGFIEVEGNEVQSAIMMKKLRQMGEYCETNMCRRKFLLNYFDEKLNVPCNNCDVCLNTEITPTFDGTIIAQKLLSAIMRLNQKFGAGYVIDFLKGSDSKKIREEHRRLPTFGKGKEHSRDEWKAWIRHLINEGYLQQSEGEYTLLQLSERSRRVLYEGEKITLPMVKTKKEAVKSRVIKESATLVGYDRELFEILRVVRMELATSLKLPPYIIFPDSTLAELSTYYPQSLVELNMISGFGQLKLEKYGEIFLMAIKKYCIKKNIKSKIDEKSEATKMTFAKKPERTNTTKLESLALFQKGKSIEDIARERNLAISTITSHLTHFVLTGELNVLKFINKEKLKNVEEVIREYGTESAGLIKLKLGDNYSYAEINAAINYHLKNNVGSENSQGQMPSE